MIRKVGVERSYASYGSIALVNSLPPSIWMALTGGHTVEDRRQTACPGTAEEVRQRILEDADRAGANTVLVHLNRGAMPHEMFMEQIRRFGTDVLPALQAHKVAAAPLGSPGQT